MLQKGLILLMILFFAQIGPAQNKTEDPEKVLKNFWNLARQRDLNQAGTLVADQYEVFRENPVAVGSNDENSRDRAEQNYSEIWMNAGFVAGEEMEMIWTANEKISDNLAVFDILAVDKKINEHKFRAVLIKRQGAWKILFFQTRFPELQPRPTFRPIPPHDPTENFVKRLPEITKLLCNLKPISVSFRKSNF